MSGFPRSVRSVVSVSFLAASLAAGTASADVAVNFTGLSFSAFQYVDISTLFAGVSYTGTLTGVTACITLDSSTGGVRCDEFSIYIDVPPLSTGGLLQLGGFSNLSAAQRYIWATGGSSAPGTLIQETVVLTSAITLDPSLPNAAVIYFGSNAIQGTGTWSGTVVFQGLDGTGGDPCVPAPSALAVMALGGLARGRRRR